MAKRKRIPQPIQDEVLTRCARRCCLCYGLNKDFEEKKGQIAHLDQDSSNDDLDNLAFLCFDHHDQYDSRTSQSKGLTMGEVKGYRTRLHKAVASMWEGEGPGGVKAPVQVASAYLATGLAGDEGRPRVFLCHAKEDKPHVQKLYHRLKGVGYQPWLDEEDLLPGQDWELEIRRAIRKSDFFLACLSRESLDKRGYVQKEIRMGLDELDKMPEGKIYLIPVRLEACEVPERLQSRQRVDFYEPNGFEKLKQAMDYELGKRQAPRVEKKELPAAIHPTLPYEPELILIRAGEFLMGSDPDKDNYVREWEQPQHRLTLPDYYIAKTPVTNAQYLAFVEATGQEPPRYWESGNPPIGKENHPVTEVNWHDAKAYCDWLTQATGKTCWLPSEAEWEKGARGTDGRIYPWGNQWDTKRCNTSEEGQHGTAPVGTYPQGESPDGLLDMAGNVWEWTRSVCKPYPYDPTDGRENLEARNYAPRVLRGGSFGADQDYARCAYRGWCNPDKSVYGYGFRVVVSPVANAYPDQAASN